MINLSSISDALAWIWKSNSSLIPIHKNSSRHLDESYRGLTELTVLPKLVVRFVPGYFSFAIKSICHYKNALPQRRSTFTNFLQLTCQIFKAFSSGYCRRLLSTQILTKPSVELIISYWFLDWCRPVAPPPIIIM